MTEPTETATSRVRTFLIADVRGYTKFTNERGDEAAAALADRFAGITQEVVGRQGGEVIELRGDEALAVFDSPRQVLRAALTLQDRFRVEREHDPSAPLHVGMGIDAGEAVPVQGGYRSGALNLAARLCSIAGPGEIFASEEVVHLARKMDGLLYLDRGEVQLKGLADPIRVIQVAPEGTDVEHLPRFTIHVTETSNLPTQLSTFIGREREVAAISGLLRRDEVRLVTLCGPGGAGKTRLALQVAGEVPFGDGVFLVSLAPLTDPELVPPAIASVLAVKEAGGDPLDPLAEYLRDKDLLLILDNFEHLLAARAVVTGLLQRCPRLKLLITSREALHVTGEQQYPVPPLPVPDPKKLPDLATLTQYDAVSLFIARATAVKPAFEVTNENAAAVAEICYRLDGLPLAIELAAARSSLFPPQALLDRLDDRLKLLRGGSRDAPARQQTLRDTLAWSYDLLSGEERQLFAQLGIFAGGCTLEAAEAVCDSDVDSLASLVDKSLITSDGERLMMLETIRDFSLEKLEESDKAGEIRRRHAEYFLALARSANLTIEAEGQMRHDLVIRDQNNVRGALEWALQSGEIELGLDLACALENYWATNSPLEGKHWLGELLARAGEIPGELRAWALRVRGVAMITVGETKEGMRQYEASLDEYRRLGDERGVGIVLQRLAVEALKRGEIANARGLVDESLALHQKLRFKKGEAVSLGVVAQLELIDDNEEAALSSFERSASLAEESGFVWWHANMLLNLGELLLQRKQTAEADDHIRQALLLYMRMGDRQATIFALALLAQLAAETGQPRRAGRLWGAIEAEERRAPASGWESEREEYAKRVLANAGPEFERGREEGARLSLNQAVEDILEEAK